MLKRNAGYEKNKVFQKKSRINGQEYILSLDLCMLSYFPWGFFFSSHFFGEGRSGGVTIFTSLSNRKNVDLHEYIE